MKRYFLMSSFLGLSLLMVNTSGVKAASFIQQSSTAQPEFPQAKAKRMVSTMHMTVELQGNEWKTVNDAWVAYYVGLDGLDKQKATLSSTEYTAKVAALKKTRDESLKATLIPEQWRKWEVYKGQHKEE